MTRKHFTTMAAEINVQLHNFPGDSAVHDALLEVARTFAVMARQSNPQFQRARFMEACGFGDE
jgi:hypothetical protein